MQQPEVKHGGAGTTTGAVIHNGNHFEDDFQDVFDEDFDRIQDFASKNDNEMHSSATSEMNGSRKANVDGVKTDEEFDAEFKKMLDGLGERSGCENEEDVIESILRDDPSISPGGDNDLGFGDSGNILAPLSEDFFDQKIEGDARQIGVAPQARAGVMAQAGVATQENMASQGNGLNVGRSDTSEHSGANCVNNQLLQLEFGSILQGLRENRHLDWQDFANTSSKLSGPGSLAFVSHHPPNSIQVVNNQLLGPLGNNANDSANVPIDLVTPSPLASQVEMRHQQMRLTPSAPSFVVCDSSTDSERNSSSLFGSEASSSYASERNFGAFEKRAKEFNFTPGRIMNTKAMEKVPEHSKAVPILVNENKGGGVKTGTVKRRARKAKKDLLENVSMGFFSGVQIDFATTNRANDDEGKKREVGDGKKRRRAGKKKVDLLENVGMGFFSGVYVAPEDMVEKKVEEVNSDYQPRRRRRRNPKPDLLENITMGFFSMNAPVASPPQPTQQREISDIIKPLYSWAPDLDEKTRVASEYALPVILPAAAVMLKFSTYGVIYALVLPIFHTLECALTNFGPETKSYRFSYAPISPFWHLVLDECLSVPLAIAMVLVPEHFGPYSYFLAFYVCCNEYFHWAYAYKDLVRRRKLEKMPKKKEQPRPKAD